MTYDYKASLDRVMQLTDLAKSGPDGMREVVDCVGMLNVYEGEGGLLRGIAEAVLPKGTEFQVFTMIDGSSQIIITRTAH